MIAPSWSTGDVIRLYNLLQEDHYKPNRIALQYDPQRHLMHVFYRDDDDNVFQLFQVSNHGIHTLRAIKALVTYQYDNERSNRALQCEPDRSIQFDLSPLAQISVAQNVCDLVNTNTVRTLIGTLQPGTQLSRHADVRDKKLLQLAQALYNCEYGYGSFDPTIVDGTIQIIRNARGRLEENLDRLFPLGVKVEEIKLRQAQESMKDVDYTHMASYEPSADQQGDLKKILNLYLTSGASLHRVSIVGPVGTVYGYAEQGYRTPEDQAREIAAVSGWSYMPFSHDYDYEYSIPMDRADMTTDLQVFTTRELPAGAGEKYVVSDEGINLSDAIKSNRKAEQKIKRLEGQLQIGEPDFVPAR